MNDTQAKIVSGLHAHFKQPSGPSRPGYDWIVLLSGASGERKILARTYDDDVPGATAEQQAQRALDYVVGRLNSGSLPPNQQGNPALVIVPKSG